jgi:leucyl/phenylalanyl-tRNA--protein transferase
VEKCADRNETWINADIYNCYCKLHDDGFAHSVEVWRDDRLIGGIYGVAIGAAFFGESMFSEVSNGSKIALTYLHDRLLKTGFMLFDTQFLTEHLASLGAIEITQADYLIKLDKALNKSVKFLNSSYSADVETIAHRSTQTS